MPEDYNLDKEELKVDERGMLQRPPSVQSKPKEKPAAVVEEEEPPLINKWADNQGIIG